MSRVGRKPIVIPSGVEVTIAGSMFKVKGPKGELSRSLDPLKVKVKKEGTSLIIEKDHATPERWGLARALLSNMVTGAHEGFSKSLEVHGVGYRAAVAGQKLTLEVGFSHPVEIELPKGVSAKVTKNQITLTGPDREQLGNITASIRKIKPPEPYKGTGLRYVGEHVRQKEGKKAAAEGAAGGAK